MAMTNNIKIGDKVRNEYNNRTGVVISIAPDMTGVYDLATRKIVSARGEKLIANVLCELKTFDQKPMTMTREESFNLDDLVVVA
jgi:hypothetical protein